MRIETVSMERREAILTLDANELVLLCNALYHLPVEHRRKLYYLLRSDLMLARDMSQYGRIDNLCLEKIMECRSHLQEARGDASDDQS